MGKIQVERSPDNKRLEKLGVFQWPTWDCEPATFPWTYNTNETCYFLEGDVTIFPEEGDPVTVGKGDLVTFPQGLSCTWEVRTPVNKHYNLY